MKIDELTKIAIGIVIDDHKKNSLLSKEEQERLDEILLEKAIERLMHGRDVFARHKSQFVALPPRVVSIIDGVAILSNHTEEKVGNLTFYDQ